jgi:hypothetical protein
MKAIYEGAAYVVVWISNAVYNNELVIAMFLEAGKFMTENTTGGESFLTNIVRRLEIGISIHISE